jgi:hypothetical protein
LAGRKQGLANASVARRAFGREPTSGGSHTLAIVGQPLDMPDVRPAVGTA